MTTHLATAHPVLLLSTFFFGTIVCILFIGTAYAFLFHSMAVSKEEKFFFLKKGVLGLIGIVASLSAHVIVCILSGVK